MARYFLISLKKLFNTSNIHTEEIQEEVKEESVLKNGLVEGYVDYEEKFGLILWYTCVYVAYAPIKNDT